MRGSGIPRRIKVSARTAAHKYPYRVQCNVCGWKGRCLFDDSWHCNIVCPGCGSQVRHRLLVASLGAVDGLGPDDLLRDRRVLHFAPETVISRLLADPAAHYVSADLYRNDVDVRLDICNMSSVADGSFDLVVACDVLEHVPDDSAALREIHRVLATHRWAILTVPQKDNLEGKFEDHALVTPEERRQAFGQEDHLRIYGDDFGAFVEAHGFTVVAIDERDFSPDFVRRHVLSPPVLSVNPFASNHRRVYFAQKKML